MGKASRGVAGFGVFHGAEEGATEEDVEEHGEAERDGDAALEEADGGGDEVGEG